MPFQPAIIDRNPSPAEAPATPGWPETAVCLILLGAAVVKLWLLPLASGFWLDETGTFWVIKGGFSGIAPRCLLWTAQSPLYSFIVWAAAKVGGMHEPVLRLPSTLASAAGAYILFQLGRKLLNARAALVAVLLFVCAEPVAFAAADARPYAIATTVALAAMLMLVRWCETQQAGDGVLYCLLAALTLYFHFVFATTLLVHLVYAAYRLRFRGRAMAGPVLTGGALVLVFSIPLMPFALALARSARSHSFAGTPDWTDLFSFLAPPAMVCAILAGAAAGLIFRRSFEPDPAKLDLPQDDTRRPVLALLAAWLAIPAAVLFLVSTFTPLKVFLPRYLLPSVPAVALLAGWALAAMSAPSRMLAATVYTLSALAGSGGLHPTHGGDWRAAIQTARRASQGGHVLIRCGYPEAAAYGPWARAQDTPFLFAPLDVYGSPGEMVRLPFQFTPDAALYLERVAPELQRDPEFLLLTMGGTEIERWLQGRLSPAGFLMGRPSYFGGSTDSLRLIRFVKATSLTGPRAGAVVFRTPAPAPLNF